VAGQVDAMLSRTIDHVKSRKQKQLGKTIIVC